MDKKSMVVGWLHTNDKIILSISKNIQWLYNGKVLKEIYIFRWE